MGVKFPIQIPKSQAPMQNPRSRTFPRLPGLDFRPRLPDTARMKPLPNFEDPVPNPGHGTIASHFGEDPLRYEGAATPPVFQTSTFIYPDAESFASLRDRSDRHTYTRVSNPTRQILEAKLARLEHGEWCECHASGMGAITAAINACVSSGAHVVAVQNVYGPSRSYLKHLERFGVSTTYVPGARTEDFIAALRPETKLLYLESPTSGFFECPDTAELARSAREHGIVTLFDNSYASPIFMNPLDLGVDLVVHSATKYINGHSDVVAGCVIGRSRELFEKVQKETELGGATIDPFAAWLMLRGLRTLAVRMRHHQEAGLAIARALEQHPRVARVLHPGLESHPEHAIAKRQLRGFSSLFSFVLKEQSQEATFRFLNRAKLFAQGVSWGGFESLAVGGTFFSHPPAKPEWIIRLYAGLETTEDLVADVLQALD